jgi:hypothetical protein
MLGVDNPALDSLGRRANKIFRALRRQEGNAARSLELAILTGAHQIEVGGIRPRRQAVEDSGSPHEGAARAPPRVAPAGHRDHQGVSTTAANSCSIASVRFGSAVKAAKIAPAITVIIRYARIVASP